MEPTDIQLMLRAQQGDVEAFHQLTLRYREPLRRFFAALLADRSQADDFVQETFLRLWMLRDRYEPTGKFSTYLFQIGKHFWLNQRKKFRPQLGEEALEQATGVQIVRENGPEAALLQQERRERLRRAVEALPEHYRVVFTLNHMQGLRYAEIACRLEIPVGTVKSRMAEAVRRLRFALTAEGSEEPTDGTDTAAGNRLPERGTGGE